MVKVLIWEPVVTEPPYERNQWQYLAKDCKNLRQKEEEDVGLIDWVVMRQMIDINCKMCV